MDKVSVLRGGRLRGIGLMRGGEVRKEGLRLIISTLADDRADGTAYPKCLLCKISDTANLQSAYMTSLVVRCRKS